MRRRPLKTGPLELVLTPVDNQRLANLCGTLDENLRQIETALDVRIARRGERFTVRGAHAAHARIVTFNPKNVIPGQAPGLRLSRPRRGHVPTLCERTPH